MHALCLTCEKRGQIHGDDCCFPQMAERRFKNFSGLGLRTYSAKNDSDKWGYDPSKLITAEAGKLSPVPIPQIDYSKYALEQYDALY